MRAYGVALLSVVLECSRLAGLGAEPASERPRLGSASDGKITLNVFFGTNKVVSVQELRTNALRILESKGYTVPASAECVLNVQVLGHDPGCAVMFVDSARNWLYQVAFDGRAQILAVRAGPIRHRTPRAHGPPPEIPLDGVVLPGPPSTEYPAGEGR